MHPFKFKAKSFDGRWIISDSYEHANNENIFVGDSRVQPASVSLFTGLFDANAEPVFEGDILSVDTSTLTVEVVIVWNYSDAKFQADRTIGGKFSDLSKAKVSHWNIIGHYFDRLH